MIGANDMSTSASGLDTAAVYTDFHGLAQLRKEAQGQSPESVRKVAQQFEAVFIQMMLKNMRNTGIEDELFGSDQAKFYRDMFDQQLSVNLSEKGAFGLADLLVRQLTRQTAQDSTAASPVSSVSGGAAIKTPPATVTGAVAPEPVLPAPLSMAAPQEKPVQSREIRSPEEFIKVLGPLAENAAQGLGVSPRVLLAQAALETGWGQGVMRNADGSSSHNLFGIKADARWSGERVVSETLEYEDGLAVKRRETFRSYDSYEDSFADYVDFLRSSPRYGAALADGADPQRYIQRLQQAGYATDPEYAGKINRIAYGEGSRMADMWLMDSAAAPLTDTDESTT